MSRAGTELSLFRLYALRVFYLVLALGLGVYYWPTLIGHDNNVFVAARGIQCAMLSGLGLTAALGLRYPVKMLPILLFEVIWKAIYMIAFAAPLWSAHQISDAVAADIQAVLMVVVLVPLIPWRYVVSNYVLARGDRWR